MKSNPKGRSAKIEAEDFFEARASDALKNSYGNAYYGESKEHIRKNNEELNRRRKRANYAKASPTKEMAKRLQFSTVGRDYMLTPFDQRLNDGPTKLATRVMQRHIPTVYPPLKLEDQLFLMQNANNPDELARKL